MDQEKIERLALSKLHFDLSNMQDFLFRASGSLDLIMEDEDGPLYGQSGQTLGQLRNRYRRIIIEIKKDIEEIEGMIANEL